MINNVFYCGEDLIEGLDAPVYCVCNYIGQGSDGEYGIQKYKSSKIDFTSELNKFCKQPVSQANIFDKKLIKDMKNFIQKK